MATPSNQDAVRLVETFVKEEAAKAVGVFIKGKGETLPSAADFIGQQFVKTGDDAGLYVATGTTTPGWKAV